MLLVTDILRPPVFVCGGIGGLRNRRVLKTAARAITNRHQRTLASAGLLDVDPQGFSRRTVHGRREAVGFGCVRAALAVLHRMVVFPVVDVPRDARVNAQVVAAGVFTPLCRLFSERRHSDQVLPLSVASAARRPSVS